jgi:hypothetical protein
VSVEVRIIWYQSQGSKIRFTILLSFVSCYHLILFHLCSLFLILVIILSCFVCIDCSLFLFCFVHQVKKKKIKKEKRKKRETKKKKVLLKQQILSFIVLIKVNFSLNRDFSSFFSFSQKNLIFVIFL